ncbi:MAG TPA: DinB family protein [Pyrinomonadaceae bacterium]|nr:DinB family protein [Pyrinomonadaceae bacterium]
MEQPLANEYLQDALGSFRAYKKLAERALEQLKDEEFFINLDEEANSVAVIMKHMAGNMISRWTDFLTTDGEKPDRQRDKEFILDSNTSKEEILAYWERGWSTVFKALDPLQPDDFSRKVSIRGEQHTIVQAINRQMTHYAYHIGQIVFLAKHFRSREWKSLTIPRNRSAEVNASFAAAADQPAKTGERFDVASRLEKEKSNV